MPRKTSRPSILTTLTCKQAHGPEGKTSNGKERKDIVIFERRSGLGVRKQAETGVTRFLIQLRLPDGRRWRETLRPPDPHLSLPTPAARHRLGRATSRSASIRSLSAKSCRLKAKRRPKPRQGQGGG